MRDNNFNLLRIIAGIGVLIGHLSWHMGITGFGYDDTGAKPFWHLGVPFFLILTGFFLYPSFIRSMENKEGLSYFFIKRFLRIAPSIYLITIVTVILLLSIGAIDLYVFKEPTFIAWLASNVVLVPLYNPDIFSHIGVGVINGSLWTIFAQVGFFIFIPFIYLLEKKFGFKKMITVLLISSVLFFIADWYIQNLKNNILLGSSTTGHL